MRFLNSTEEASVRTAVELAFPGRDCSFLEDKGGASIVFVQLADVPPSDVERTKRILENILSTFKMRAELLPRIICSE